MGQFENAINDWSLRYEGDFMSIHEDAIIQALTQTAEMQAAIVELRGQVESMLAIYEKAFGVSEHHIPAQNARHALNNTKKWSRDGTSV